jgi:hypothetical protein
VHYDGGDEEDYKVYDAVVGVDYAISPDASISVGAGYYYQDREESGSNSGPVVEIDGDWVIKRFKRGSITATAGTGYRNTFFGAENLGFTEYYEAGLTGVYSLTRHLTGHVIGTYDFNNYVDEDREDHIATVGTGLNYAFRPWLSLGLRYRYHVVDSTEKDREYDENRVAFSVSLTPSPIRLPAELRKLY